MGKLDYITCFLPLNFCIFPNVLLLKLFRHFGWFVEPLGKFDLCLYFAFVPLPPDYFAFVPLRSPDYLI